MIGRIGAWMDDHDTWVVGLFFGGLATAILAFTIWGAVAHAQETARMTALGYHQVCVPTGELTYTTICSGGQFNVCTTTARPVLKCTWER